MRRLLWTAMAVAVAGCGADAPVEEARAAQEWTSVDSAGVTVVESRAPAWSAAEAWRVGGDPELVLGHTGSGEAFFHVRGATCLKDGRIAVADYGSAELRYYDPAGRFLDAVGGAGEGPGEFGSIGRMWRARDSLYVFEYANLRMSVLSEDGAFGRVLSFAPGRDGRLSLPVGVFADGSFLMARGRGASEEEQGLQRDTLHYSLRDAGGEEVRTYGRFPGDESYVVTMDGRTMVERRPFGVVPGLAVGVDHFYFGRGDSYRIEVYGQGGSLDRVILRPVDRLRVDDDDAAAVQAMRASDGDRDNPYARAIDRQIELPEWKPAHGSLRLDTQGNLWVARYAMLPADEDVWSVFDQVGRWLGDVETPAGGTILEIGDDYILGVWRDDYEVEEVRRYRLEKPAAHQSP